MKEQQTSATVVAFSNFRSLSNIIQATAKTRVFLDLSKAFDSVWHEGLLYELKCSGVSGELFILIRNSLNDRQQRVVLNGKCSRWATVSAGVPQGCVLGPLFFLVYINDIVVIVRCDIKLFADDTSIFSVVRNDRSSEELNRDLERLQGINPCMIP